MTDFVDSENATRRRGVDPMIEIIMHDIKRSRQEIVGLRESMDKVGEALTKLAVIEERQSTDKAALERAFMAIQKTDERTNLMFEKMATQMEKRDELMTKNIDLINARLNTLESAAPQSAQVTQWVTSGVWAAAGLAVYIIINKLGLVQ